MGATGICWDNSPAESLWSTFKHEQTPGTQTELVAAIDKWVRFYRGMRRHSSIGMLGPDTSSSHTERLPVHRSGVNLTCRACSVAAGLSESRVPSVPAARSACHSAPKPCRQPLSGHLCATLTRPQPSRTSLKPRHCSPRTATASPGRTQPGRHPRRSPQSVNAATRSPGPPTSRNRRTSASM